MAHRWELDPITFTPAKPISPQHAPPKDMALLSAWRAEMFLHRTPMFSFGLTALALGPTLGIINAGLADPSSPLYEQLIRVGSDIGAQMSREVSDTSEATVRWLAKTLSTAITLDHRKGPLPIAAAEVATAFTSTAILFGGGVISGIRQWFDKYDGKLERGDVPVSGLYPVKRIVVAHPIIAENYLGTLPSPSYGTVYIRPRQNDKKRNKTPCTIPSSPYGYRVRLDALDERIPGKRRSWCSHVGLDGAGTVIVLPQKPGHELFGRLDQREVQPYHVAAMLDEMKVLRPYFWEGKTIKLGFPPQYYYDSSSDDPTIRVMQLGRQYGASMVDVSPEGKFVQEMRRVATIRARNTNAKSMQVSIGVLPVGRVNSGELVRMVDQLQRDEAHPEGSISAEIVSPESRDPTLGFDVLALYGKNDEAVVDFARGMQGVRTDARATMIPIVREPKEESRAGKQGIPAYTITYESY